MNVIFVISVTVLTNRNEIQKVVSESNCKAVCYKHVAIYDNYKINISDFKR